MSFSIFLLIVYGVYYYVINYSVLIIHYVELNNKENNVWGIQRKAVCINRCVQGRGLRDLPLMLSKRPTFFQCFWCYFLIKDLQESLWSREWKTSQWQLLQLWLPPRLHIVGTVKPAMWHFIDNHVTHQGRLQLLTFCMNNFSSVLIFIKTVRQHLQKQKFI